MKTKLVKDKVSLHYNLCQVACICCDQLTIPSTYNQTSLPRPVIILTGPLLLENPNSFEPNKNKLSSDDLAYLHPYLKLLEFGIVVKFKS